MTKMSSRRNTSWILCKEVRGERQGQEEQDDQPRKNHPRAGEHEQDALSARKLREVAFLTGEEEEGQKESFHSCGLPRCGGVFRASTGKMLPERRMGCKGFLMRVVWQGKCACPRKREVHLPCQTTHWKNGIAYRI